MPLHDWTRVPAGLFHHFHQDWSIEITRTLNRGMLPEGTIALVEQQGGPGIPDVLAIEANVPLTQRLEERSGGTATLAPPVTPIIQRSARTDYAHRANRIVIRHHLGQIIAVMEIISPGNKDGRAALQRFVQKTTDFLYEGIHFLVVDLFPPSPRDPLGIHQLIWEDLTGQSSFTFPSGKDRVLASYEAKYDWAAYVAAIGVGDPFPDMPLFLTRELNPNLYVMVPLESTYKATWEATPRELRTAVETGVVPNADRD